MAETFPEDADLNALSEAVGDIGVPPRTTGQAPHYTAVQKLRNWLDRVLKIINACRCYKDSDDGDLQFSVYAGPVQIAGAQVDYAGSNQNDLTNNADNYIYLDSAGTLTVNTTGFPSAAEPHMRLAVITTSAGEWDVLDDLVDHRDTALFAAPGGGALADYHMSLDSWAGDFELADGGWGTGTLTMLGSVAQNTTQTNTQWREFVLPPEYRADEDVKLVVHAEYSGAGTAGTCTVDVEVYEMGDDGTVGADLCATAAQSLTNAFGDKTFTITDTSLAPGDRLRVFVRTSVQETADAGPLQAVIGSTRMQLDTNQ